MGLPNHTEDPKWAPLAERLGKQGARAITMCEAKGLVYLDTDAASPELVAATEITSLRETLAARGILVAVDAAHAHHIATDSNDPTAAEIAERRGNMRLVESKPPTVAELHAQHIAEQTGHVGHADY